MLVVDAQVHLGAPDRPERPWIAEWAPVGHQTRMMDKDELIREMNAAGVNRAIVVPPSWEGDRNDVALDAAATYPDRLAVMGRLPLTPPDPNALIAWREQPGMLGVRATFSLGVQRQWLTDGTADWLWPAAEANGIPVMVYPPGLVPELSRVARRYPGLRIVVDHLGLASSVTSASIGSELEVLYPLADLPNVAVKASGLQGLATDPYPFADIHANVREVVRRFGPQRVFWGSDLTVHPCTYNEARSWIEHALSGLSAEDMAWIMGRGIVNWLGWEVR